MGKGRGLEVKTSDFSIARILAHDYHPKSPLLPPNIIRIIGNDEQTSNCRSKGLFSSMSSSSCSASTMFATRNNDERENDQARKSESDCYFDFVTTQRQEDGFIELSSKQIPFESACTNVVYPWLRCTRYKPPKIPRKTLADKNGKRRPGQLPRIPFSSYQLQILEESYTKSAYLSRRDISQLSISLRLPQSKVKIWFQNRRARERRESGQRA